MKLRHSQISIQCDDAWLHGELAHAPNVRAVVLLLNADPGADEAALAPASATALASAVQDAGFATLCLHLLSAHESAGDTDAAYNIPRLAQRVRAALEWIAHQPPLARLPLAIVAGDTACAAAIRVAAAAAADEDEADERIAALVVCGGRADLAGAAPLRALRTPTRFVLDTGADAASADIAARAFALIPSAGADRVTVSADSVAATAACLEWLNRYLPSAPRTAS